MTENGALKIIDPKFSDEGSYECVAQNSAGEIFSKAALNYFGVEGNRQFSFPVAKEQSAENDRSRPHRKIDHLYLLA